MFFGKYKSHYSLNFFAFCGWVNLIIFSTSLLWQFLTELFDKNEFLDVVIPSVLGLNWFFAFYATATFFIFMFENFYELKITNENFLNNILIDIFRIIGFVIAVIPFMILFAAFLLLKF